MTKSTSTDKANLSMHESIRKLLGYGFRVELDGSALIVRTQSGTGRVYNATDEGAAKALEAYECQLAPEGSCYDQNEIRPSDYYERFA